MLIALEGTRLTPFSNEQQIALHVDAAILACISLVNCHPDSGDDPNGELHRSIG